MLSASWGSFSFRSGAKWGTRMKVIKPEPKLELGLVVEALGGSYFLVSLEPAESLDIFLLFFYKLYKRIN